jgi:hypothetical protein
VLLTDFWAINSFPQVSQMVHLSEIIIPDNNSEFRDLILSSIQRIIYFHHENQSEMFVTEVEMFVTSSLETYWLTIKHDFNIIRIVTEGLAICQIV